MFLKVAQRFNPLLRSFFKKPDLSMLKEKKYIIVPAELTIDGLSNELGILSSSLIEIYKEIEGVENAEPETIISRETSEIIIQEFNCLPLFTAPELKVPRPPVVTIMGHVDHGKTTLLDSLRNSKICATEFGGITQAIGAFTVKASNGDEITFIDTPGHLAFRNMRERGAEVTDIIVLVICAVEGIQPQTIECIEHAKDLNVPIIIAINKVDLGSAEPAKVELDLLKYGLTLDKYGGDVLHVNISAKKRIGLEKLEEAINLQAEMMELKEAVDCNAKGYILESKVLEGRGPLCSVLIKRGTLRVGDAVVAGGVSGKIKHLINENGKFIDSLLPSQAAELYGFKDLPLAGSIMYGMKSLIKASVIARRKTMEKDQLVSEAVRSKDDEERIILPNLTSWERNRIRNNDASFLVERLKDELELIESGEMDPADSRSILQLHKRVKKPIEEQIEKLAQIFDQKVSEKSVKLILKAQNHGMLEAVEKSIKNLAADQKVKIDILRSNIGTIGEEDIELATENEAHIFCMNIKLKNHVISAATKANITIKSHKIIYHLLDDVQKLINDLEQKFSETVFGSAVVKNKFEVKQGKSKKLFRYYCCGWSSGERWDDCKKTNL